MKQDMDVDHAGTAGGVRTLASAVSLADRKPGTGVRPWLDRRHLIIAYILFLAYAAIDAIGSAGEDQVWAIWAACGYAVALLVLWRWGHRTVAVLVSVALAVLAPLLWLSVAYPLEDGMMVIERSASLREAGIATRKATVSTATVPRASHTPAFPARPPAPAAAGRPNRVMTGR